jgi:hypothetical protein
MTLIPPRGYAEDVLASKRKTMNDAILAQVVVKDALGLFYSHLRHVLEEENDVKKPTDFEIRTSYRTL